MLVDTTPKFVAGRRLGARHGERGACRSSRAASQQDYRATLLRFLSLQAAAGDAGRRAASGNCAVSCSSTANRSRRRCAPGWRSCATPICAPCSPASAPPALVLHGESRPADAAGGRPRCLAAQLPQARYRLLRAQPGTRRFCRDPASVRRTRLEEFAA
ncbi:MAG: hypothetical protein MZV65_20480 [Chromatiales bacterium]|nr:hypothetical protein [Chromatiales bacterium]